MVSLFLAVLLFKFFPTVCDCEKTRSSTVAYRILFAGFGLHTALGTICHLQALPLHNYKDYGNTLYLNVTFHSAFGNIECHRGAIDIKRYFVVSRLVRVLANHYKHSSSAVALFWLLHGITSLQGRSSIISPRFLQDLNK